LQSRSIWAALFFVLWLSIPIFDMECNEGLSWMPSGIIIL
jgi:hypothetical protein